MTLWALSLFRIQATEDGFRIPLPPTQAIRSACVTGRWLGLTLSAVYFVIILVAAVQFPYASPVASADEQLLYYHTARSIVKNELFRPYRAQASLNSIYQPPGPEILVALLIKLFGERYWLVRITFALIFLAGIAYYLRFTKLLLTQLDLKGEGYTFVFLGPWMVMHNLDHPAYSAFPLFAFFPIVALHAYYRDRRRRHLLLALIVVFLSSVYLTSEHFAMVLVSWLLLYMVQLVPFDRTHLGAFLAVGLLGILLQFHPWHWEVVTDVPGGGASRLDLASRLELISETVRETPARKSLGFLALAALVVGMVRVGRYNAVERTCTIPHGDVVPAIRYFGGGVLWIIGTISIPLLLFPVGKYRLQGVNQFFLAIGAVAVVGYALREIIGHPPFDAAPSEVAGDGSPPPGVVLSRRVSAEASRFLVQPKRLVRACLWLVLVVTCVSFVWRAVRAQAGTFTSVEAQTLDARPYSGLTGVGLEDLIAISSRFKGKTVMTNVYPGTASFFTQEAAFGGCEFGAFPPGKPADPSQCHPGFRRSWGRRADVKPTHYLLFRGHFRGLRSCQGECLGRLHDFLTQRYEKVFDNGLLVAFELEPETELSRSGELPQRGDFSGARR